MVDIYFSAHDSVSELCPLLGQGISIQACHFVLRKHSWTTLLYLYFSFEWGI